MNGSTLADLLAGTPLAPLAQAEDAAQGVLSFFQKPAVMVAAGALTGLVVVALVRAASSHQEDLSRLSRLALL